MELIIKKQIGKIAYTFVVAGKNLFDTLMEAQRLSFGDIDKCGLCKGDNLQLAAHKAGDDGEYEYVAVRCLNRDCRASLTFGKTKKDPNTFFPRRIEGSYEYDWKPYEGKENGASAPKSKAGAISLANEKDDLPF